MFCLVKTSCMSSFIVVVVGSLGNCLLGDSTHEVALSLALKCEEESDRNHGRDLFALTQARKLNIIKLD